MTETTDAARLAGGEEERPDLHKADPPRSKKRRVIVIAAIAVVVAAAVAVGLVLFLGRDSSKPDAKGAAAALTAGLQAQGKGDLTTATNEFNKVLSYDKHNKYALYDLALIDSAHSDYGLAEAKYQRVLDIDGTYEPALFNLAILRQAKGDNAGATALYLRAISAAPGDASAHLNLGLLLRSTGHNAAGDTQVKAAIKLNPKLVDPARQTAKAPAAPAKQSSSKSHGG